MAISVTVNGQPHTLDLEPDTPLLWALRDTLGLTGTKFGCGIAACGACTVHVDGKPMRSCSVPVVAVEGASVTTIEGLAPEGDLHPVQQAWIDHQVPQCGYCQSGHDHGGVGAPRGRAASDRRADRRRHHQHLPLRHVRARAPRDPGARTHRVVHRPRFSVREASAMGKWTRRAFIGTGTLVGGGFVLGVAGRPSRPAGTASCPTTPTGAASSIPGSR